MSEQDELLELIQRYTDGIATAEETALLQQRLKHDAGARRAFRQYLELDAALERVAAAPRLPEESVATSASPAPRRAVRSPGEVNRNRRQLLLALAGVPAATLLMFWLGRSSSTAWATVVTGGPGVSIESHGQSRPARPGDQLHAGESITVQDDAIARVRVAGVGSAVLGPSTRLQSAPGERTMELLRGSAEISVDSGREQQTWHIRTPQAEASVASTEINIASSEGRTALRVADGNVQLTNLSNGTAQTIQGGERALLVRDSPPVVSTCRPGSALVLTSRRPPHADWDTFSQLIAQKLLHVRLWQMGFRVDVVHFEDVQPADLADRALVIVSLFDYGVGESAIKRIGLARAPIPVICLEPAAYPELGMSPHHVDVGFGFRNGKSPVDFVAPHHPLAAGRSGLQDGILRNLMGWARPAGHPTIIGQIPGHPEQAVVFAYDQQQMLAEFPAPARRVGLFVDPNGISEQVHVAWLLLEAAVNWCVETGPA